MSSEIVCNACGAANRSGEDFCGQCGSYLEWEGTPAVPEADDPPTLIQPVVVEEPPRTVVEPEPVGAVLPEAPAPRPRAVAARPEDRRIRPGDLICGRCGTGNDPARHYCRRCGHDLAEAQTARTSWWRRLFARPTRVGPVAGTRPRRRRRHRVRALVVPLLVLLVVAGGVVASRPYWSGVYGSVLDRVRKTTEVFPHLRASSSRDARHGPHLMRAGVAGYWAPEGLGRHAWVQATFDAPVRLVYITVKSGTGAPNAVFENSGRPVVMTAIAHTADGTVRRTLRLEQTGEPQLERLGISGVKRLRLRIDRIERGTPPTARVAIAQLEFYVRR